MSTMDVDSQSSSHRLRDAIRQVRERYDRLHRGQTAALRRCRTAEDVALEGSYWQIGGSLAQEQRHLPHVVLLFPLAAHVNNERFSVGRYLRRELENSPGAVLRIRRVLDSRDRDELDHRMRGLLRLAAGNGSRVDWGTLGTDLLWFFAESGSVRRRWAQDFFAPSAEGGPSGPSSDSAAHLNA